MQNYTGYDKIKDIDEYSARKLFNKKLVQVGSNIELDGRQVRAVIENQFNPYAENKEDRKLQVLIDQELKNGSYVKYDNEMYLIVTDIDKHYIYKDCKIRKCNQVLKWKDGNSVVREFDCIISNDSYGSKTSANNDFLASIDTKMKIQVQSNQFIKSIKRGFRFVFNKSEFDIFKCVDITTSVSSGITTLICQKESILAEDDLENNLAYNSSSNTEEPPLTNYKIVGNPQIKVGTIQQYVVDTSGTISWNLDNLSNCSITTIGSNRCEVKALVRDELNVLTAIKDRVPIAKLNIETMR